MEIISFSCSFQYKFSILLLFIFALFHIYIASVEYLVLKVLNFSPETEREYIIYVKNIPNKITFVCVIGILNNHPSANISLGDT